MASNVISGSSTLQLEADVAAALVTFSNHVMLDRVAQQVENLTQKVADAAAASLSALSAQSALETVGRAALKRKRESFDTEESGDVDSNKRPHLSPILEISHELNLFPHELVPSKFFHVGGIYLCYHEGAPNTQDFPGHYRVKLVEKSSSTLVFQYLSSTGELLEGAGQKVTKTLSECRLWNIIPLRWDPTLSLEETTSVEEIINGLADTPHRFNCFLCGANSEELTGLTTGYFLV